MKRNQPFLDEIIFTWSNAHDILDVSWVYSNVKKSLQYFQFFFSVFVFITSWQTKSGWAVFAQYISPFQYSAIFSVFSVFVFITSYKVAGQYLLSIYHLFSILQYFQYFQYLRSYSWWPKSGWAVFAQHERLGVVWIISLAGSC